MGGGWSICDLEGRVIDKLGEHGCVMCKDDVATYKAMPCHHKVLCASCHGMLQSVSEAPPPICPLCRVFLSGYRKCK